MYAIRSYYGGIPVAQLCREHGMSSATFYKWRSKYGGIVITSYSIHYTKLYEIRGTGRPLHALRQALPDRNPGGAEHRPDFLVGHPRARQLV